MLRRLLIYLITVILLVGCKENISIKEEVVKDDNIISTILVQSTDEETGNRLELYYDGKVKLRINETEVIVSENAFSNDIEVLKSKYNMFELCEGVIAVSNKEHSARRDNLQLDIFIYKSNEINKIWSSNEISAKIQNIHLDNKSIDISIPKYNITYTITFTDKELIKWEEKINELEANKIYINESFLQDIKNNLILSPIDYVVNDSSNNSNKELLVLLDVFSVGAKPPIVEDRAIIKFEISSKGIEYKYLLLERDIADDKLIFSNFL